MSPSCSLFRRLRRFSSLRDEELLEASVSLAEAQVALAMHFGHRSWKELIDGARSHPPGDEFSLKAVRGKPGSDGPPEVFAFLPQEYGLGYEHALTSEPDRLWTFVRERVDSGLDALEDALDLFE